MNSKNFTIGVLALTAAVLFVGLVLVNVLPQRAVASDVSAYGGDFTITIGRISTDTELLYVIDNTTQRMITYGVQRDTAVTAPAAFTDLSQAPAATP